ncbi:hypothetical protein ONA91_31825 [Micromonospora sp. DR5-3]|uniref:hypothetical protein n=1 Tax=unclassified Micromonospora TaxID=2617518 RepID=UPI0011DB0E15|nr:MULTISPECIES: hypothetical protein [unclassified Micromonospora]MCW3819037.1 hypothetical protein [Micromonospora sp. DR5-3]TYC19318.1 hypothetical protein FXF52_37225 [Micromonospora sp. MP36]
MQGVDPPEAWDAELAKAVRQVAVLRTGFYVVVLLIALGGQVSGAVERLGMPWYVALPAVGALELGGVVVLANADVRRRLGERAMLSRVLSACIAAAAVAFNWLAHSNHLEGGFYAGMSLLGYLVWLMNTENQRRDRLRARQQLPPTTPAYEPVGHWLRHPWLTRRAQSLAKADPDLGLYGSLDAARAQIRAERRQAALSKVLHRKISRALDATTANIALAVYDLDEIARRLAEQADYDGLTTLIAADLAPARVLAGNLPASGGRRRWRRARQPDPAALAAATRLLTDTPQRLPANALEPDTGTAPAPDVAPAPGAAAAAGSSPASPPVDGASGGSAGPGSADNAAQQARDGAERPGGERSRAAALDRTDRKSEQSDSRGQSTSTTNQLDPPRASDWAALHAELAPLLPAAAPRRTPRNTPDRSATSRAEASATTDVPGSAEPADTAPPATTRNTAPTPRAATGRARVARANEPADEPIAAATRELPLVAGRDLPDLVHTAASRTTSPVAVPDAAEGATEQRSASRPRQRRRDDADPRPSSETARRRPSIQSAEAGRH